MDVFKTSLNEIQNSTCVILVERSDEEDYIEIITDEGKCDSNVGRVGGAQKMDLKPYGFCIKHELVHALGFQHMHKSFDRDDFVRINEDNIADPDENIASGFNKMPESKYSYFGTSYDFDSIMHVGAYLHSKQMFDKTIEAIDPNNDPKIENLYKKNLSSGDIRRINNMFNCDTSQE